MNQIRINILILSHEMEKGVHECRYHSFCSIGSMYYGMHVEGGFLTLAPHMTSSS